MSILVIFYYFRKYDKNRKNWGKVDPEPVKINVCGFGQVFDCHVALRLGPRRNPSYWDNKVTWSKSEYSYFMLTLTRICALSK